MSKFCKKLIHKLTRGEGGGDKICEVATSKKGYLQAVNFAFLSDLV